MKRKDRISLKCCVIGDSALTIQCCRALMIKGHEVIILITHSYKVKKWGIRNDIIIFDYESQDLYSILSDYDFDYLFSIVFLRKIEERVLSLPKEYAINYHDSFLPKYGGINATSWAIMNDEKSHGVTWHVMTSKIDEGDIIIREKVAIEFNETAETLNYKCYRRGIETFNELVDQLATNTYTLYKQNLCEKSYYGKYQNPTTGYILDFKKSASKIDSFIRGLNLGNQVNNLGEPILSAKHLNIIVKEIEKTDIASQEVGGTIIKICNSYIEIATKDYDVKVREVYLDKDTLLTGLDIAKVLGIKEKDIL